MRKAHILHHLSKDKQVELIKQWAKLGPEELENVADKHFALSHKMERKDLTEDQIAEKNTQLDMSKLAHNIKLEKYGF